MKRLLLIACSKYKHRFHKEAPAKELYTGTLLRLALRYAEENDLEPMILSAKYGLISPDTVIATYDLKRESAYEGPWPKGEGYYAGGQLYFGKAPARFQSLVPDSTSYSSWVTGLLEIVKGEVTAEGVRPLKVGGITDWICKLLLERRMTRGQLLAALTTKFGPRPGMMKTIDAQVRQSRMGKERNVTVRRQGSFFWVEAGLPVRRAPKMLDL